MRGIRVKKESRVKAGKKLGFEVEKGSVEGVFVPPFLDPHPLAPPRLRLFLGRAAAIVEVVYHPLIRLIGRLEDRTYLLSSCLFPSLDAPLERILG